MLHFNTLLPVPVHSTIYIINAVTEIISIELLYTPVQQTTLECIFITFEEFRQERKQDIKPSIHYVRSHINCTF
jgi:hypothetical protein